MTSASEFHNRRSRFDRNTFELRLDSPVDRIAHHNHHQNRRNSNHNHTSRRDRNDSDNCDPLRRSSNSARLLHRLPFPDRESIRVEQGSSQSGSNNNNIISPENISSTRNRQNFSDNNNDRLPGSVLLARERLLHRLQGVSISTNRQRNRVSSIFNEDDLTTFGVSNRVPDPEDWDINSRTDMLLASSSSQEMRKRPCGISEEAFKCLNVNIFRNEDEREECSVCLESFTEGEKVLSLSCGHIFHSCCLEPWVTICADCPNCRTSI